MKTQNLVVIILTLILIYLIFQEYSNKEGFFYGQKTFQLDPEFKPLEYQDDYKGQLNQDSKFSFTPSYDLVKRKRLNIFNNYSIKNELNLEEMTKYLEFLQEKINQRITLPNVLKYFNEIERSVWREKELMSDLDYNLMLSDPVKNKYRDNYIKKSRIQEKVELLNNNFVNLLNNEFPNTRYFQKYNKYHSFSVYHTQDLKILKYFDYVKDGQPIERFVLQVHLHRKHKINDFVILLDYFVYSKLDEAQNYNDIELVQDFTRNNFIYLKTAQVIGMPLPHNNKYLDFDDTDYQLEFKPLIDYNTKEKLYDLEPKIKPGDKTRTLEQIQTIIKKVKDIDLNKNLDDNIFNLVIAKSRINQNDLKTDKEKELYQILETIIQNGAKILNEFQYQKKEFNQEQEYDLEFKPIFDKSLASLIKNLDKNKKAKELSQKFQCFHPYQNDVVLENIDNKPFCISYHNAHGGKGIWDRPCETNEECPYYKANKNYPNDFGGCVQGVCQMPKGVRRLGKRQIAEGSTPLCYNCDDKYTQDCCYQQSTNTSIKSPDYIFEGDKTIREKFKDFLKKLDLNIF